MSRVSVQTNRRIISYRTAYRSLKNNFIYKIILMYLLCNPFLSAIDMVCTQSKHEDPNFGVKSERNRSTGPY